MKGTIRLVLRWQNWKIHEQKTNNSDKNSFQDCEDEIQFVSYQHQLVGSAQKNGNTPGGGGILKTLETHDGTKTITETGTIDLH